MEPPARQPPKRAPRPRNAKRFFLRGLITVLPAVFTVLILVTAYRFVDQYVTGPVNSVLYWTLENNTLLGWRALRSMGVDPYDHEFLMPSALPLDLQDELRVSGSESESFREAVAQWRENTEGLFVSLEELAIQPQRLRREVTNRVPPVIGLVVSILLVFTLGSLAGGFIGSRFVSRAERALHVIPVVRSIYPYTKQLVDFFLADRKIEFEAVVSFEYPRHGVWSTGFVTSSGLRTLRETTRRNLVSVFVPSSPMPMTGYTIFVPAEDLIPLPFSVDEALRVIVSGGVLVPLHERMEFDANAAMAHSSMPVVDPKRVRPGAAGGLPSGDAGTPGTASPPPRRPTDGGGDDEGPGKRPGRRPGQRPGDQG